MDVSSIAVQGIQQADMQLDAAASRLVRAATSSADGNDLDMVSLSAGMVALMSARNLYEINLTTLKVADQVQKALIDVTG